ncbi:hypothetical protein [Sphingomonas bacterium]|uniref:hypothetical protein n=1 Tax=Sphingomonas bacterium TaxID=1895847 RepID=UPI0020C7140A|nr:hypothetical protein [Sphingomonas bacterium]
MTIYLTLFSALMLVSSLSGGQADQRSAADAAKAFSLDLPAANAPAAVSDPDAPPSVPAVFTLDTPIGQIIADPKAKLVLDTDLPGLSTDTNLAKFQSMSLRQFQPMTGGQMTDALLAKTGADLAAIAPSPVLARSPVPVPRSPTSRRADNGR